jgi:hypothetical protein
MLTWTTYGTWLQGCKKGYVKKGKILGPSESLEKDNLSRLRCPPVRLNHRQKIIVETAIRKKALELNQKIWAIIVYSNHMHVVVEKDLLSIEETVSYYKNAARVAQDYSIITAPLWSRLCQIYTLSINLGKAMHWRICGSPVSQAMVRSMPRPKPPCGTEPNLRKSRYQL